MQRDEQNTESHRAVSMDFDRIMVELEEDELPDDLSYEETYGERS